MASAAALLPGFQYKIKDGDLADEVVTIKDNTPFPDYESCSDPKSHTTKQKHDEAGCVPHPLARKVTVLTPEGHDYYILPRQLRDTPVGMAGSDAPAPVVQTVAAALTTAPIATAPKLPAGKPKPINSIAPRSASHPGAKTRGSARCEASDTHSQRMPPAAIAHRA